MWEDHSPVKSIWEGLDIRELKEKTESWKKLENSQ